MKSSFSNRSLSGWLNKRPIRWWIVSLGSFFGGSYLVTRYFGVLAFLLLAIAAICIGSAVTAYLNWNRLKGTHTILWIKNAPQITRTWDYRPKDIKQRNAAFEREQEQAARITGLSSAAPNENEDVWHNFISPEEPTEHASSSEDADRISAYD